MGRCMKCNRYTEKQYHFHRADGVAGTSTKSFDLDNKKMKQTTITYSNYREYYVFLCESCARSKIGNQKEKLKSDLIRVALYGVAWILFILIGGFLMNLIILGNGFWYVAIRIVILILGLFLVLVSWVTIQNLLLHLRLNGYYQQGILPDSIVKDMLEESDPKGIYLY